jgi:hypothetical protein
VRRRAFLVSFKVSNEGSELLVCGSASVLAGAVELLSPTLVDRRAADDGLPVAARKSKHNSLRLCCRPGCRRPFTFDFDLR